MIRKAEIKRRISTPFQGKRKRWEFDCPVCDILVDGRHVGYCTPNNPPGEIRITDDTAPADVIEAATKAVEDYYEEKVDPERVGVLKSIEAPEEDEELDG